MNKLGIIAINNEKIAEKILETDPVMLQVLAPALQAHFALQREMLFESIGPEFRAIIGEGEKEK